jgi:high affinity sulfate transporter 1
MSVSSGGEDEGFRRRANTGGIDEIESRRRERVSKSSGPSSSAEGKQKEESRAFWNFKNEHIVPEPVRSHFMPPKKCMEWKNFVFRHLPILSLLWTYRLKFIIGDLIAGITIGVTHIPQGIGFALLANLPVEYGLYSSFVPPLIYTILGTSKHISVGTFPVVSLMVGEAVQRLTSGCIDPNEGTINSTLFGGDEVECTVISQTTAINLSFLVGIIMIGCGLLQLGCITLFLSESLVSGYTCAAAFTILITQLRAMLGLPREIPPGHFQNIRRLILYFHDFVLCGSHNNAAIAFALISSVFLVSTDYFNKFLNKYLRPKLKGIPVIIPAQLLVVIVATGISYGIRPPGDEIQGAYNLTITGEIPGGSIPVTFCMINRQFMQEVIADAFVIAIISYVINISQAKLFARKSGYDLHSNQEFLAYGSMNLIGSFFGSFPTAGALSRTVLQHTLGGNTQLVSVLSSIIVLITVLALTFLFTYLPIPALAAIIATALLGLYLQIFDLKRFFKISFIDGCIWIVVFTATFIIGLDIGLLCGVVFSLGFVVVYTILPSSGQIGVAEQWDPEKWRYTKVSPIKGVYIFRFEAPIYFLNAAVFRAQLVKGSGLDPSAFKDTDEEGMFSVCFKKLKNCKVKRDVIYDTGEGAGTSAVNGAVEPSSPEAVNLRYITESGEIRQMSQPSTPRTTGVSHTGSSLPTVPENVQETTPQVTRRMDEDPEPGSGGTGEGGKPERSSPPKPKFLPSVGIHDQQGYLAAKRQFSEMPSEWKSNIATHGHVLKYHTIIIDCSPVPFVDASGVEMLYQVISDYDELYVQVLLARPNAYLLQLLKRVGFFDIFSSGWIFPSLEEAVRFAKSGNRVRNQFVQESLDLRFMTYLDKQAFKEGRFEPFETVQQIARRFSNPSGMRRPSASQTPTSTTVPPLGSDSLV